MTIKELAKELGVTTDAIASELKKLNVGDHGKNAELDDATAQKVRRAIAPKKNSPKVQESSEKGSRSEVVGNEILLDGQLTVKAFADLLGIPGAKIVAELIKMGKMLPLSAILETEIAEKLAEKLGYKLISVEEKAPVEEYVDPSTLQVRPPVVTVMGHVDHGKTTLLDAIRATHVADREAGGITQHIGASWVNLPEGRIVFLDTPGHEAFTKLRARGAHVTDIVVLIVAADDGVMPQTIEAINHSRDAGVPIIVAINKIDKNNADVDRVKNELVAQNLVPEEWGGQTQMVAISAKKKEGIKELLELVLLQAEVMDLKADYDCLAEGVVIESKLDVGKGPVATVMVKKGVLKCGDPVVTGLHWGRIRNMLDWTGKSITTAGPSTPVEILGLSGVPKAGDLFKVAENEKVAKETATSRQKEFHEKSLVRTNKITFDDLFSQIQTGNVKELKVVLKADAQGSAEAIEDSLSKLSSGEVQIKIIHSGIGAITDNDVMLASASNGVILGFNVRPVASTRALAEREKVEIRTYRIIYEMIEEVKAALKGMLDPVIQEVVQGQAEVRATFNVPKIGTVAGCQVTTGRITRASSIRLIREGIVVWEGKLATLRRFKDDVKEVTHGFECGIGLDGYHDVKIGDVFEAFTMEEVK